MRNREIDNLIQEYTGGIEDRVEIGEDERRIIRYAVTKGYNAGLLNDGLDVLVIEAVGEYQRLMDNAALAAMNERIAVRNQARGGRIRKHITRKKGKKNKKSRKQRGGDIEHVFHKLDLDSATCAPFPKIKA